MKHTLLLFALISIPCNLHPMLNRSLVLAAGAPAIGVAIFIYRDMQKIKKEREMETDAEERLKVMQKKTAQKISGYKKMSGSIHDTCFDKCHSQSPASPCIDFCIRLSAYNEDYLQDEIKRLNESLARCRAESTRLGSYQCKIAQHEYFSLSQPSTYIPRGGPISR